MKKIGSLEEVLIPLQLSNLNTTLLLSQVVSIIPSSIKELRTVDDDLGELNARAGINVIDDDMYAGTKAKDEGSVVAIENQISARQEHLAWGGHGCRHLSIIAGGLMRKRVLLLFFLFSLLSSLLNIPEDLSSNVATPNQSEEDDQITNAPINA